MWEACWKGRKGRAQERERRPGAPRCPFAATTGGLRLVASTSDRTGRPAEAPGDEGAAQRPAAAASHAGGHGVAGDDAVVGGQGQEIRQLGPRGQIAEQLRRLPPVAAVERGSPQLRRTQEIESARMSTISHGGMQCNQKFPSCATSTRKGDLRLNTASHGGRRRR